MEAGERGGVAEGPDGGRAFGAVSLGAREPPLCDVCHQGKHWIKDCTLVAEAKALREKAAGVAALARSFWETLGDEVEDGTAL